METIYLCIVIFLFVLAVFDLIVGVSNDAVNFLQSAVGAKAASFKTVLFIAGIGVFIGASLSNGMMDIARHGIYQPEHFYFAEIMCILLAVMLTDVVLLDVFNTMGMPTSTTVSMVFELLGGTFALAPHQYGQSPVRHHGYFPFRSHCLLLRYAGAMAGTCGVHLQLHQEDEVQHRHLRRHRSNLHYLFHADKRAERQFIHDPGKQAVDTR